MAINISEMKIFQKYKELVDIKKPESDGSYSEVASDVFVVVAPFNQPDFVDPESGRLVNAPDYEVFLGTPVDALREGHVMFRHRDMSRLQITRVVNFEESASNAKTQYCEANGSAR